MQRRPTDKPSRHGKATALAVAAALAVTGSAGAEMSPTLSFSGVPGIIDMPSGEALKDGGIAVKLRGLASKRG